MFVVMAYRPAVSGLQLDQKRCARLNAAARVGRQRVDTSPPAERRTFCLMNAVPTQDLTSSFSAVFAGIIVARNAVRDSDPHGFFRGDLSRRCAPIDQWTWPATIRTRSWTRVPATIYISRNLSG